MDRLAYTVDEAAAATSLSVREIRRRVASGELPSVRIGRRAVIRAETLAAWLAEHETTGAA